MDAKERIMNMLEEGKITADEAAKLLKALNTSSPAHDADCRAEIEVDAPGHRILKRRFRIPRSIHRFPHRSGRGPRKVIVKMTGDPDDIDLAGFECLE